MTNSGHVHLVVLAHGGGLPEAASLAVPLVALGLYVVLQRAGRRRTRRTADPATGAGPPADPAAGPAVAPPSAGEQAPGGRAGAGGAHEPSG